MIMISEKMKRISKIIVFIILFIWGIATTLGLVQMKNDYESLNVKYNTAKTQLTECRVNESFISDSYKIILKENHEKDTKIGDLEKQVKDLQNEVSDLKKK